MRFNPALVMNDALYGGDGSEPIEPSPAEAMRAVDDGLRRKLAAIKMASRVVALSLIGRVGRKGVDALGDAAMLAAMRETIDRMGAIRRLMLAALGVTAQTPGYSVAFNAATSAALDVLAEEERVFSLGGDPRPLSLEVLGELLSASAEHGPMYLGASDHAAVGGVDPSRAQTGADLMMLRRLALLEVMPRLWACTNLFDYFQAEPEAMVSKLAAAVSEQAEASVRALMLGHPQHIPLSAAIVQSMYSTSARMMCEVFRREAGLDVARLRAMAELERSVHLQTVERAGGMPYGHLIETHARAMGRVMDAIRAVLDGAR